MPIKLASALLVLPLLVQHTAAQSGTVSVGPLLTCSITTFACPGVSGCCTIGGCCGSGCCPNGYTCINEGTSAQACCPASDPTKCGTASVRFNVMWLLGLTDNLQPSGSGSSSTSSGSHTCTGIQTCPRDVDVGLAWTCLLGQTCGFSYRQCNPCPYIGGGGSSSSGSSPDSSSSSSPSSNPSDGDSGSSSNSETSASEPASSSATLPSANGSDGESNSGGGSSPASQLGPSFVVMVALWFSLLLF